MNRYTQEKLKGKVDEIIDTGCGDIVILGHVVHGDPERAHELQDKLHLDIIRDFAPQWIVDEIERLQNADFPRWCA